MLFHTRQKSYIYIYVHIFNCFGDKGDWTTPLKTLKGPKIQPKQQEQILYPIFLGIKAKYIYIY